MVSISLWVEIDRCVRPPPQDRESTDWEESGTLCWFLFRSFAHVASVYFLSPTSCLTKPKHPMDQPKMPSLPALQPPLLLSSQPAPPHPTPVREAHKPATSGSNPSSGSLHAAAAGNGSAGRHSHLHLGSLKKLGLQASPPSPGLVRIPSCLSLWAGHTYQQLTCFNIPSPHGFVIGGCNNSRNKKTKAES